MNSGKPMSANHVNVAEYYERAHVIIAADGLAWAN
jgi:hypothetical protein